MASTSIPSPFPDDQQQQQQQQAEDAVPVPGPVSNNAWNSSGSIGPFFAVISVLTVLAIISCILGRICRGRRLTPLESIKGRDCWFEFGWFRRKGCLGSVDGAAVLGNKVVEGQKESNDANKAQDGSV